MTLKNAQRRWRHYNSKMADGRHLFFILEKNSHNFAFAQG